MNASNLFKQIEELIPKLDGWCVPEKAAEFAAIIIALRIELSVEIGVWGGRGTFAMALAHRFTGRGKVIAIDPWSAPASVAGQEGENAEWWKDQTRHDLVYNRFLANIESLGLQAWIDVKKARSDQVVEPRGVGLLVIDGNHGEQAMADVKRFTPFVNLGGIVYLDDLNWQGGAVTRAAEWMTKHGYCTLFARDQGAFFQRVG